MLERVEGFGGIAVWDQGYAAARDKLARSAALVLVTVDAETREVAMIAVSKDLTEDEMIRLLDCAVDGALRSIDDIVEACS